VSRILRLELIGSDIAHSHCSPVNETYCDVPDASVTVKIPVIGVEEHQFTVMVQLAPEPSVPQVLVSVKGVVTLTDLMDVLELNGLLTVAVPDAQANMTSKLGETVTRAALPLNDVDLLAAPFTVNFT
jgi:hypothetical protein